MCKWKRKFNEIFQLKDNAQHPGLGLPLTRDDNTDVRQVKSSKWDWMRNDDVLTSRTKERFI